MSPFLQLVNIALGFRECLHCELDEQMWLDVLEQARKHAVLGLIFVAMTKLPQEQQPHRRIKVRLGFIAEEIEKRNAAINAELPQIYDICEKKGIKSCLLKGQGLSLLYPMPQYRQCGDIDMWVDADVDGITRLMPSRWRQGEIWYHHVEYRSSDTKVSLEIHRFPSWMNSPIANSRLQKYFYVQKESQMSNFNAQLGCNIPTVEFNLVYNMIHIYRHVLFEGIGLRQFVDYVLVLRNSTARERVRAMETLSSLGIGSFVPAVMYMMKSLFELPEEYMLSTLDTSKGKFLLEEVRKSGNFGKSDGRNKWRSGQNYFQKAWYRMLRLSRFITFAWSEVMWAPYFKLNQFVWKRIKHYK